MCVYYTARIVAMAVVLIVDWEKPCDQPLKVRGDMMSPLCQCCNILVWKVTDLIVAPSCVTAYSAGDDHGGHWQAYNATGLHCDCPV